MELPSLYLGSRQQTDALMSPYWGNPWKGDPDDVLESDKREGSPAGAWSGKLRLEGRERAAAEDLASNIGKGSRVRSRGIQEQG